MGLCKIYLYNLSYTEDYVEEEPGASWFELTLGDRER